MSRTVVFVAAACVAATACSSDPSFTDDDGTGARGGATGTGANGGSGTGASSQGGSGTGASGAGAAGGGGDPTGGGPVGGGGTGGVVMFEACGDGLIDTDDGEECDDANATNGDGCSGCIVDCPAKGFKDPATRRCYFTTESSLATWQQAVDECANSAPGTTLAVLGTVEEIDLVFAEFVAETFWIGGHDMNVEGSFEWINGEPWAFTNGAYPWAVDEPNNVGGGTPAHCAALDNVNGPERMFDRNCANTYDGLCEREPLEAGAP